MPKEKKKRGRRDNDKKRKLEAAATDEDSNKRPRPATDDEPLVEYTSVGDQGHTQEQDEDHGMQEDVQNGTLKGSFPHPEEMPFYGLLDEEEQEYFRRADEMLELNQFSSPEDRETFLNSVYKEAEGKELKLANSQSCSRLMERLIQLSTTAQLKTLFQKFSGHFLHLVQHRFASHCCEALFIQAAPIVTLEVKDPPMPNSEDPNEIFVTMEDLYLHTIKELDGYLGYLMMDRFASHTLRVLLAVLSGQPLARSGAKTTSVLHSKKKEHISVAQAEKDQKLGLEKRVVPDAFTEALEIFVSQSVSGFDTPFLQSLSMHATGNPTLQLLLQLELTVFGKSRAKNENSIIHKLLPDDPITEESDSGKFINSSIYDVLGSRLLETILSHSPGKLFKHIYKVFIKDRIASLARNDVASYSVVAVLHRLSKEDLEHAMELLVAQMQTLADRNRTVVIKTLIERCSVRGVHLAPIADALAKAYGGPNGFDITQLLKLSQQPTKTPAESADIANASSEKGHPASQHASEKLHGSLLAQAMVSAGGGDTLGTLIYDSLSRIGTPLALQIAKDNNASRVIQAVLVSTDAPVIARRKIIQQFYGHIAEMALDPSASHVIDAIWTGSSGLAFIRERVAEELAENEAALRESHVGRAVWRNWKMDLYKRRRRDWVQESRSTAGVDGFLPFPSENKNGNGTGTDESHDEKSGREREREREKEGRHLSAIEKARLKHAKIKENKEKKGTAMATAGARFSARRKRLEESRNDEDAENMDESRDEGGSSAAAGEGSQQHGRRRRNVLTGANAEGPLNGQQ